MLFLIPNLCSFRSIGYRHQIPTVLLSSKLQTLTVRNLYRYWDNIQNVPIINLTVWEISLKQLHRLFFCTPMLKYLNVHLIFMHSSSVDDNTDYSHYYTTNLQKIVIHFFNGIFQDFKMFVKQTPSLKSLTISSRVETLIDAYGWQDLITISLPYLKTFKFEFTYVLENNDNIIIDKFKQFQNSFWLDQHHWYTEYVLDRYSAYIYTIPYISNTYILTPYTNRYSNKLINNFNKFNNVTNLILYQKTMKNKYEFYFSNVESLILENELKSSKYCEDRFLHEEHVLSLKMIINVNISSKCRIRYIPKI
jgi:hypothetical protein